MLGQVRAAFPFLISLLAARSGISATPALLYQVKWYGKVYTTPSDPSLLLLFYLVLHTTPFTIIRRSAHDDSER